MDVLYAGDEPLLAATEFEAGRSVAYATDPCPEWGKAVLEWGDYDQFWAQLLNWVTP